jgi:molybdopterin molybdotransferase
MALLSVPDALATVLARVAPLGPERVSLLDAVGRVLAESVTATRRLPAWDNSAMDGYAVRAADTRTPGVALPVAAAVAAGDAGDAPLPPGAAVRIFTGAPLPPGADAVVIQEDADTVAGAGTVTFRVSADPGDNIRRAGSDVEPGAALLAAGRTLTPGDLALLAAQARLTLAVHRAPRVAIVSSGNELVEIDAGEPGRGQIANTNAWALAAAVRAAGGVPRILPILRDDRAATEIALAEAAAGADLLLTSGGASVGDHDHVGPALKALSGEAFAFWKVALKPGKPLIFGRIGACTAFGLPGNPISALVTFEIFVRPALLRLQGHAACVRRPVSACTVGALAAGGPRTEYLRAALSGTSGPEAGLWVDAGRPQGSGSLSSLAGADALIVRAPGCAAAQAGERVEVLLLGPDEPGLRLPGPFGLSSPSSGP